jgi:hypothetical protein
MRWLSDGVELSSLQCSLFNRDLRRAGNRSAQSVTDRRVRLRPVNHFIQLLRRGAVGGNAYADANAQWTGRHRLLASQNASMVGLALDSDLQPLEDDAELGRAHGNNRGVTVRERGSEEPTRRGRAAITTKWDWHISEEHSSILSLGSTTQTVLDHSHGCFVGRECFLRVLAEIL